MAMNEHIEISRVDREQRPEASKASSSATVQPSYGYREVTDSDVHTPQNCLDQMKANIEVLEDLHGRLRFLMGEIKQHVVKS